MIQMKIARGKCGENNSNVNSDVAHKLKITRKGGTKNAIEQYDCHVKIIK